MQQRTIGPRSVSAIGLGGMPMSIEGRPDEARSIATIHAALDAGVTLIDTADAYHLRADDVGHNEELIAQTLVTILRRAGHHVDHAPDGAVAWERIQNNLPEHDLLVFDINMPGLDGIELARRVRQSARYTGKILIISGRLSPAEKDQLAEIGVDATLPKPFTMDQFRAAVSTLCAGAPAR